MKNVAVKFKEKIHSLQGIREYFKRFGKFCKMLESKALLRNKRSKSLRVEEIHKLLRQKRFKIRYRKTSINVSGIPRFAPFCS